jgi:hypothetical protein
LFVDALVLIPGNLVCRYRIQAKTLFSRCALRRRLRSAWEAYK